MLVFRCPSGFISNLHVFYHSRCSEMGLFGIQAFPSMANSVIKGGSGLRPTAEHYRGREHPNASQGRPRDVMQPASA